MIGYPPWTGIVQDTQHHPLQMADILRAWHTVALNEWIWSPGPGWERDQPCPSPPRSGKSNTRKKASVSQPNPRSPARERAVSKKKTYRRHPAGTCGQVFPLNAWELFWRIAVKPGYEGSELQAIPRLPAKDATGSVVSLTPPSYPRVFSLSSKDITLPLAVPVPKPWKNAGRTQRAPPKARTTRPRARRAEVGGIDVAYAFGGNSGYCSSSLRHSGPTSWSYRSLGHVFLNYMRFSPSPWRLIFL